MVNFKKGDKVLCINTTNSSFLKKDIIYTIHKINLDGSILSLEEDREKELLGWDCRRFILATKTARVLYGSK